MFLLFSGKYNKNFQDKMFFEKYVSKEVTQKIKSPILMVLIQEK